MRRCGDTTTTRRPSPPIETSHTAVTDPGWATTSPQRSRPASRRHARSAGHSLSVFGPASGAGTGTGDGMRTASHARAGLRQTGHEYASSALASLSAYRRLGKQSRHTFAQHPRHCEHVWAG
jgi:hypothetical protein